MRFNLDAIRSGSYRFSGSDLNDAIGIMNRGEGIDLFKALIESEDDKNRRTGFFLISETDPNTSREVKDIQISGLYSEFYEFRYASIKAFAEYLVYSDVPIDRVIELANDSSSSVRRWAEIWLSESGYSHQ